MRTFLAAERALAAATTASEEAARLAAADAAAGNSGEGDGGEESQGAEEREHRELVCALVGESSLSSPLCSIMPHLAPSRQYPGNSLPRVFPS